MIEHFVTKTDHSCLFFYDHCHYGWIKINDLFYVYELNKEMEELRYAFYNIEEQLYENIDGQQENQETDKFVANLMFQSERHYDLFTISLFHNIYCVGQKAFLDKIITKDNITQFFIKENLCGYGKITRNISQVYLFD